MVDEDSREYINYRDINGMQFDRGKGFDEGVQDATILHLHVGETKKGEEAIIATLGILGPQGGVTVRQTIFTRHTNRVRELFRALDGELDSAYVHLFANPKFRNQAEFSLSDILSYFNGGHVSITVNIGHWYHDDDDANMIPNVKKWTPNSAKRIYARRGRPTYHNDEDYDNEEQERALEEIN